MAHAPMNRRTLIRTLLASAAATGTVMTASVTEAAPAPFFIVLETTEYLDQATADELRRRVNESFAGTAFGCVKILVLSDGLTLKTYGADGRLLSKPTTVRAKRRRRAAAADA